MAHVLDEQADRSLFLAPPAPAPPEEPPAGPSAPLAEVEGGRRRWLAVLVVLALLVAGAVANRRSAGRVDEDPVEPPGADQAAAPPALLAPSLRTIERQGQVLPGATGTALVVAARTQVVVLDVDSGTVRSLQAADLDIGASYPWGSQVLPVGDDLVVRNRPPRALLVPRSDGGPVEALDAGSGGGLHRSDQAGRYWVEELRGDARLEELDGDGEVHRTVRVLDGVRSIVWDGRGFLQSADGRVLETGVDEVGAGPDGGVSRARPVPIAEGTAIAADAGTVAVVACPDETCVLELVDRASGASRAVPTPDGTTGFLVRHGGTLSPDGRWLLVGVARGELPGGEPAPAGLAVVDVAAGSVRAVEPVSGEEPAAGAFSPDGRWLFLASSTTSVEADVAAVDLTTGDRHALATLSLRGDAGIVLEAFPSVPADLGQGGS